jgi:hypothetical protein
VFVIVLTKKVNVSLYNYQVHTRCVGVDCRVALEDQIKASVEPISHSLASPFPTLDNPTKLFGQASMLPAAGLIIKAWRVVFNRCENI